MASKDRYAAHHEREVGLKRLALQVAVQLPENAEDALQVLDLARVIVTDFLMDDLATESRPTAVFPLALIR